MLQFNGRTTAAVLAALALTVTACSEPTAPEQERVLAPASARTDLLSDSTWLDDQQTTTGSDTTETGRGGGFIGSGH